MTVVNTPFTVTDTNGHPLCHSLGASKDAANSARKRAMRERFAMMLYVAGENPDRPRCVTTGKRYPMADVTNADNRTAVVERSHVIADNARGAFCPCNMVPEHGATNAAREDAPMAPHTFIYDPREHWYATWVTHYARPSQVLKAVKPSAAI